MVRHFATAAGAALALAIVAVPATAQEWPTKPVRVIVPFTAGSATDLVPRIVFEQVQTQTGQTFIVDNRPGGGFMLGINAVKTAPTDGYTVLVHSNAFVTAPAIQPVSWNPSNDFDGVTPLANVPLVLVISPEKKIDTLKELVEQARAKPGSLNYAAAGIGSPPHLTMERFRIAADITGQLVPFKGAPEALNEVVAGRVDVYFSPLAPAMALIQAGKLKPLAVSGLNRAQALPDVPTTTEARLQGFRLRVLRRHVRAKKTPNKPGRAHARGGRQGAGVGVGEGEARQDRRRADADEERGLQRRHRQGGGHRPVAGEGGRHRAEEVNAPKK